MFPQLDNISRGMLYFYLLTSKLSKLFSAQHFATELLALLAQNSLPLTITSTYHCWPHPVNKPTTAQSTPPNTNWQHTARRRIHCIACCSCIATLKLLTSRCRRCHDSRWNEQCLPVLPFCGNTRRENSISHDKNSNKAGVRSQIGEVGIVSYYCLTNHPLYLSCTFIQVVGEEGGQATSRGN